MKILIVGRADTIFLVNYVKALKEEMKDAVVHLYSPFPNYGEYPVLPYDKVVFDSYCNTWKDNIPKLSFLFQPFALYRHLIKFLEENKKEHYDIIHFHRVLPAWTLGNTIYKKYCKKLYISFWGGELDSCYILMSSKLYYNGLAKLLQSCDKIIGSMSDKRYGEMFPFIKDKCVFGILGSSIVDHIASKTITELQAKEYFNIPSNKITVMLGYSGKQLHNHCKIMNAIAYDKRFDSIRDQIHIVASMTRGSSPVYNDEVENCIRNTGVSYTFIKDGYSTDRDIAKLRCATNILFQLSDFDYLSASVKECLCAGSIMICGNWFPYQILKDDGFIYPEIENLQGAVCLFFDIIENYKDWKKKVSPNTQIGAHKYSWRYCIVNWANAYRLL